MKLTNKWDLSILTLNQCIVNNTDEFAEMIDDQLISYVYCNYIKDNEYLRGKISCENWKYFKDNGCYSKLLKRFTFRKKWRCSNITFSRLDFELDPNKIKEYGV